MSLRLLICHIEWDHITAARARTATVMQYNYMHARNDLQCSVKYMTPFAM